MESLPERIGRINILDRWKSVFNNFLLGFLRIFCVKAFDALKLYDSFVKLGFIVIFQNLAQLFVKPCRFQLLSGSDGKLPALQFFFPFVKLCRPLVSLPCKAIRYNAVYIGLTKGLFPGFRVWILVGIVVFRHD